MKSVNVCKACGHFNTLHGKSGCTVRFCDCKKKVKL